jgi:hypothetical protein
MRGVHVCRRFISPVELSYLRNWIELALKDNYRKAEKYRHRYR